MGALAAAEEATSQVGVKGPMGKAVEPLPPGCRVPTVQGRGKIDPAWVVFFVDDAISVDVQWKEDGARCKEMSASPEDAHFRAMGREERGTNAWCQGRR